MPRAWHLILPLIRIPLDPYLIGCQDCEQSSPVEKMSWVTIVPEKYEGDEDAMLLVSFLELVS